MSATQTLILLFFLTFSTTISSSKDSPHPNHNIKTLVTPITKKLDSKSFTIPLTLTSKTQEFQLQLETNYLSFPCSKKPNHNSTKLDITFSTTNGKNPISKVTVPNIISHCQSFPIVAGLSRSPLSLASQLFTSLSIAKQFALCLPSTNHAPGVAFFGEKPYYLLPPPGIDVISILTYTSLRHGSRGGYYMDVKTISINGKVVPIPKGGLELANGGVEISTMVPYTMLRTEIYRPFMEVYSKATAKMHPTGDSPFQICLNTTTLASTRVGYGVPQIDLTLADGKKWSIFGSNSFLLVKKDVACLAFVNGGPEMYSAMVIGTSQLEDNFLHFDLEKSQLGFSSSLLFQRTTCSNFNFTHGV